MESTGSIAGVAGSRSSVGTRVGAPAQPRQGERYLIVWGDTLGEITLRAGLALRDVALVARMNGIADPDLIYAGSTLRVPTAAELETARAGLRLPAVPRAAAPAAQTGTTAAAPSAPTARAARGPRREAPRASGGLAAPAEPSRPRRTSAPAADDAFAAALQSVASRDPALLGTLVSRAPSGDYVVRLPAATVTVAADSVDELAWAEALASPERAVLHQAYVATQKDSFLPSLRRRYATVTGASLADAITALTGGSADVDELAFTTEAEVRQKLGATVRQGRIVIASIRPALPLAGSSRGGLPVDHAYAIVGYDAARDVVQVVDPSGTAEPTAPDGGPRDGTADGAFELTVGELRERLSFIAYERQR